MIKYAILYIDPENINNLVYIKTPIEIICVDASDDLSEYVTKSKSEAYLFNTFEDAKKSVYMLKYYHRALKNLKTGIQKVETNELPKEKYIEIN